MRNNFREIAKRNLQVLGANLYPGRVLIQGTNLGGDCQVQVYALTGRSRSSQAREFISDDGGSLRTVSTNTSLVQDANLLIYRSMAEIRVPGLWYDVVSNGDQTETAVEGWLKSSDLRTALRDRSFEPDKPHYTARITGAIIGGGGSMPMMEFLVLRKSIFGNGNCDRLHFQYSDVPPGFGYCVHTYMGNGDPLPTFQGEPRLVPLRATAKEIAGDFWTTLNAEFRVALAVKMIDAQSGKSEIYIINKPNTV